MRKDIALSEGTGNKEDETRRADFPVCQEETHDHENPGRRSADYAENERPDGDSCHLRPDKGGSDNDRRAGEVAASSYEERCC